MFSHHIHNLIPVFIIKQPEAVVKRCFRYRVSWTNLIYMQQAVVKKTGAIKHLFSLKLSANFKATL
ncbi:hypothetical protein BM527_07260 [Alteromonas sp. Mex14]|nr:hypothetical protein BM527_07260 [Alteromonas sp. Mex14]